MSLSTNTVAFYGRPYPPPKLFPVHFSGKVTFIMQYMGAKINDSPVHLQTDVLLIPNKEVPQCGYD